jgi:hypothetical protein
MKTTVRVAAMIGLTLVAVLVPSDFLPIGASTANGQTIQNGVKSVCRFVASGGKCVAKCFAPSASDLGQIMDPRRPVPNEWYPYHSMQEANYYCERNLQLGPRQGPIPFGLGGQ